MNSKLELKLIEYGKSIPVTNDAELISALDSIIEAEEQLDFENRDYDLIDEAVEMILSLQNVNVDALDEKAVNISDRYFEEIKADKTIEPEKNIKKYKSVRIKWLIPVAAVMSLLVTGVLVAYACGYSVISMSKEIYESFIENIIHKKDEQELVITEGYKDYANIEELREAEPDVLLPISFIKQCNVDAINTVDNVECTDINIVFSYNGEPCEILIITPDMYDFDESLATTEIGNYSVLYVQYDNIHQFEFVNNNAYYTITANSYETLTKIIKSLEGK